MRVHELPEGRRLLAHQLECVLKVVSPLHAGVRMRPVSYRGGPSDVRPPLARKLPDPRHDQSILAYRYTEPRLSLIAEVLRAAGRVGHLVDRSGRDLERSDAFTLRDLKYWARYPVDSPMSALGSFSTYCDHDCVFCYRKGTPTASFGERLLSEEEAATRLRYHSPRRQRGLPVPMHDVGEPFLNKSALAILRMARERDKKALITEMVTNGCTLTETMVEELARLQPLLLFVSLNAVDPYTRARVMRGRPTEDVLKVVEQLEQKRVPYVGCIVPTLMAGLEDLEESIRYLDRHNALVIRVGLPGFSRFSPDSAQGPGFSFWDEVVAVTERLASELQTPLLVQPSWYWNRSLLARIDGVMRGSPAAAAGLRVGDEILKVGRQTVVTRQDAKQAFRRAHHYRRDVRVQYRRGGQVHSALLPMMRGLEVDAYPYKAPGSAAQTAHCYGVFMIDGFALEYLESMIKTMRQRPDDTHFLAFVSPLARDLLAGMLGALVESGVDLQPLGRTLFTTAAHDYWGGNMIVADLHVVEDYVKHIQRLKKEGEVPDVVLLPSSFLVGPWQMDLLGTNHLRIEEQTGCAVDLVPIRGVGA